MADQWLSIVEYARETGISDMTIRRRIRTGRIAAELRDGKYFIPVSVDHASGQLTAVKSTLRNPAAANVSHTAMKAHPSPDRTIPRVVPAVQTPESHLITASKVDTHGQPIGDIRVSNQNIMTTSPRATAQPTVDPNFVPDGLVRPLVDAGMASVEARGLIEFCHRALEQAKSTVASVEARYTARMEALNAQLAQKDQELKSLNQQVEDLQILVQLLERKK